ncbi:MAG TPA: nickel-dependent hydrogenase large subunit [Burkholderiales bacterium]|nr:nickel-dependent hydrogenase large subunit [Burkholderiales bacterium]
MPDAGLEGALAISLDWDGRRVAAARVASTRPGGVAGVLAGRRAADAVALVPRLYSVCGRSQGVAAALACGRAAGADSGEAIGRERSAQVEAEIIHEHFWRMLLDWPRAAGETGDAPLLARIRARLGDWPAARGELAILLEEEILEPSRDVLDDADRFEAWLDSGASPLARVLARLRREAGALAAPGTPLMPDMTPGRAALLARRLDADAAFARAPDWDGVPCETGARARLRAHPLVSGTHPVLARFAARLVELAALLDGEECGRIGSAALSPGDAIGWVETARGLLVHRVTLDGGKVARYQIVAPTDWNFHPRGALALELAALTAADRAELGRRVELLVHSLDPCVAWGVEVGHA